MLTIIHGDDITASRKFYTDQKKIDPEAIVLEGDKITITDLTQIFEGGGLFGESKTVFIEQLLTKRKKSNELKTLTEYLQKNAADHTIYLWEGKELEKPALSLVKTATVRIFKLPQTIFVFLDSIKPGNGKTLIKLFHQTIETTEAEMVFFMLIRQFRLLLAVQPVILERTPIKSGEAIESPARAPIGRSRSLQAFGSEAQARRDDNSIDELKRIQPWQKPKLEKQAASFTKKQLIDFYSKLFQIEKQQKTGTLTASLPATIDFLLLEI